MENSFYQPRNWPTETQQLLLRSAVLKGDRAASAWTQWRRENHLDHLDEPSYQITPQLHHNREFLPFALDDLAKLRGITRYNWVKNKLAFRGLEQVREVLRETKSDAMIIKGAPLLLKYYDGVGARMMHDIDLVVKEQQVPAVTVAMLSAGWTSSISDSLADGNLIGHGASFRHARYGSIDLHWRPLAIDTSEQIENGIWSRSTPLRSPLEFLSAPDPTDTCLISCYHARKGGSKELRWAIDLATVVRAEQDSIDWQALVERADDAGILPWVCDVLSYADQTFGALAPVQQIRAETENRIRRSDLTRYERLAKCNVERSPLERLGYLWWRYKAIFERKKQRASLCRFLYAVYQQRRQIVGARSPWGVIWSLRSLTSRALDE